MLASLVMNIDAHFSNIPNINSMSMERLSQCLAIHGWDFQCAEILNKFWQHNICEELTGSPHIIFICFNLLVNARLKELRTGAFKKLLRYGSSDLTSGLPANLNSVKTLGLKNISFCDRELSFKSSVFSSLLVSWKKHNSDLSNI